MADALYADTFKVLFAVMPGTGGETFTNFGVQVCDLGPF